MVTHDLTVEKQQIFGADKIALAANANDTISLRFHFDRNWRIFDSKAAIFRNSDGEYYIIEIKSCRVTVPWEVLTKNRNIELSVIGFEGETVITSKKVSIAVSESLLPEDCKTFSASETLFDRFKRECTAEAFLEYEDEIASLNSGYEEEKMKLTDRIAAAQKETQEVKNSKEKEIGELKAGHSAELKILSNKIAEVNVKLDAAVLKADKWDMIDKVLGQKNLFTYPLWNGGSGLFSLPSLNTSGIDVFTPSISSNLTEVGFDLSSADKFENIFLGKTNLRRVTLKNSQNITSFKSAFEGCLSLNEITIDSLASCTSLYRFAAGSTSLEKITFGYNERVTSFETMCSGCTALKEIDGEMNLMLAINISTMFSGCSSLETVCFTENTIRKSIDFRSSINLSKESMLSIVNGLSDEVSFSLYLSQYAFEHCFPTEKAQNEIYDIIMNDKGWAVGLY